LDNFSAIPDLEKYEKVSKAKESNFMHSSAHSPAVLFGRAQSTRQGLGTGCLSVPFFDVFDQIM